MTRYRQKPVEVEAWQVGSDELMPEWIRSVRECEDDPRYCEVVMSDGFDIETAYGNYIVNHVPGIFCASAERFEETYDIAKPYYLEVYDWALSRMESCDEPEFSLFSGICDVIARYRREVEADEALLANA